jgi:hypothetical protein
LRFISGRVGFMRIADRVETLLTDRLQR